MLYMCLNETYNLLWRNHIRNNICVQCTRFSMLCSHIFLFCRSELFTKSSLLQLRTHLLILTNFNSIFSLSLLCVYVCLNNFFFLRKIDSNLPWVLISKRKYIKHIIIRIRKHTLRCVQNIFSNKMVILRWRTCRIAGVNECERMDGDDTHTKWESEQEN